MDKNQLLINKAKALATYIKNVAANYISYRVGAPIVSQYNKLASDLTAKMPELYSDFQKAEAKTVNSQYNETEFLNLAHSLIYIIDLYELSEVDKEGERETE